MKPAFWSVQLKGSSKRHLTLYRENGGAGTLALCGKELPENLRRGSATTLTKLDGKGTCQACLKKGGYIDPELERLSAIAKVAQSLSAVPFTPDPKIRIMEGRRLKNLIPSKSSNPVETSNPVEVWELPVGGTSFRERGPWRPVMIMTVVTNAKVKARPIAQGWTPTPRSRTSPPSPLLSTIQPDWFGWAC